MPKWNGKSGRAAGFWCHGKGSCGHWHFASNQRCYVCNKIPGHVSIPRADPPRPKGDWQWGRNRQAACAPHRDDGPQQGPQQSPQPTTIQLLAESIQGFKASGLQDPSLIEYLEKRFGDLKKEKHDSKSHWQQARDSKSLLARKQKHIAKLRADKLASEFEIERLKASITDIDSQVESLGIEIGKLELEAAGAGGPPLLNALGVPDIPKEVLDLAQSREHLDKIQEAVRPLAEIAKPIQEEAARAAKATADAAAAAAADASAAADDDNDDDDMQGGEVLNDEEEAEQALKEAADGVEGITPEVLKRMAAKIATNAQAKRRKVRSASPVPARG